MIVSPRAGKLAKTQGSKPDAANAPKVRHCLRCRSQFPSEWAGERVCPRCKAKASWRNGSPPPKSTGHF